MSSRSTVALDRMPIELYYRILDHLDNFDIFASLTDVRRRMNQMNATYTPYEVNEMSFISLSLSSGILFSKFMMKIKDSDAEFSLVFLFAVFFV